MHKINNKEPPLADIHISELLFCHPIAIFLFFTSCLMLLTDPNGHTKRVKNTSRIKRNKNLFYYSKLNSKLEKFEEFTSLRVEICQSVSIMEGFKCYK